MKKGYIIILVIAVVIAAGLYIYQGQKQAKDLNSHHNEQYNRIIEAAQKSSIAGLAHMGRALNKYKDKKGAYPAELSALYPDYVPVQAFIDDIQWNYEQSGKGFFLSKTIIKNGGKELTAVIGPDLMPQNKSNISDIVVASVETPKHKPAGNAIKPIKKSSKTGSSLASTIKSEPMAKALKSEIPAAGPTNTLGKSNGSIKPVNSKNKPSPELEKFSTYTLTEKEQFVHEIKQKFLVWKNADGSLGFSNIDYPASTELTVYNGAEWVQIRGKKLYAQTQQDVR